MAKVLVVGGAGYVGGTACAWLLDRGHEVWVLDDLSTGHREFIERLPGLKGFVQARAGDAAVVGPLLMRERFDCVMHFAAKSLVAESVSHPALYHENNVLQTRALLETMLSAGVRRFVFSSTCAIFGIPDPSIERLTEVSPKNPINPYGASKLEAEKMMRTLAHERGLQAIALRYFNAAGAEPHGRVGEWHEPETHLIPRILQGAGMGRAIEVFGTDYPTPDGTAIRDYIHVWDLAAAHEAAMLRLLDSPGKGLFEAYNLGSERGNSVREIASGCQRVLGRELEVVELPRRPGDPPRLIGDATLAKKTLGFAPPADSLDRILASAWKWQQALGAIARRRAVFLDRDGTINVDPGYLSHPDQMVLLPGVGEALARLSRAGFALIVVSNQSGVGRGMIEHDALARIHTRLDEQLAPYGVKIDHYGLCVHKPEDDCECRKPKSRLLLDAAASLGIDVARSFMVGDRLSDLQAGRGAGCKAAVLVRTGDGSQTEAKLGPGDAAFVADSLVQASSWILGCV